MAVVCKITDNLLMAKLKPLIELDKIDKIYLLRDRPIIDKKIKNYIPPKIFCKITALRDLYRLVSALWLGVNKKIDIVMGIYFFPHGFIAYIIGKLLGKPVIQNIIGDDFKRIYKSNLLFKILSTANAIIVRGENSKKVLERRGIDDKRVFIVPNLFMFEKFGCLNSTYIEYDLVYVGNIGKVKRLDILIKLIAKLKFGYQLFDINVVIVGDGPCKERIETLANKLDVGENIHFTGYQKNVRKYLNMSKLFIMTSEYEGLPMAMIEAMACGLPCIMPDVSDINTVAIHNYNSLLYPFGNIEVCSKIIYDLLKNEKIIKRLSQNALKIRTEKKYEYSTECITNLWSDCIAKLEIGK